MRSSPSGNRIGDANLSRPRGTTAPPLCADRGRGPNDRPSRTGRAGLNASRPAPSPGLDLEPPPSAEVDGLRPQELLAQAAGAVPGQALRQPPTRARGVAVGREEPAVLRQEVVGLLVPDVIP